MTFQASKTYYFSLHILFLFLLLTPQKTKNETNIAGEPQAHSVAQMCNCDFCNEITANSPLNSFIFDEKSNNPEQHPHRIATSSTKKKRTIMIFIAAANDLGIFAARNIKQMAAIGSNEHMNILVHLDIRITGNKKITRRYFIEKGAIWHVDTQDPLSQEMDSGNPATLISFCAWTIAQYPAEEYDLFIWNHGTGILEPMQSKIINPAGLFTFNPTINKFELDRSIGFIDSHNLRGVCWDDSTGHYLSNRKLALALDTIYTKYMNKQKFGIIVFDACLMSMIEVLFYIKRYAKIMVGSQEVELGMGLNYADTFAPLEHAHLDTFSFAKHIVHAYEKTYSPITNDYTYSAIQLNTIHLLEKNIGIVSELLFEALNNNKNSSIGKLIRESRNKLICTHFDEPSYIDLYHFYANLLTNMKKFSPNTQHELSLKKSLIMRLEEGISFINNAVIANVTGKNLKNAHGISIYFPERSIHPSYQEAEFLNTNKWGPFLSHYLFA